MTPSSIRLRNAQHRWRRDPHIALALTKRLINRARTEAPNAMLDLEAVAQGAAAATTEHAEGVAAFDAKRAPAYPNIHSSESRSCCADANSERTVVVTGAAGGIGSALVRQLSARRRPGGGNRSGRRPARGTGGRVRRGPLLGTVRCE